MCVPVCAPDCLCVCVYACLFYVRMCVSIRCMFIHIVIVNIVWTTTIIIILQFEELFQPYNQVLHGRRVVYEIP